MATHQSRHALRQLPAVQAFSAGVAIKQIFEFDMAAVSIVAASDRIELGMLPAGAQITEATVIGAGLGAITADVGIMSGEFGSNSDARTVGNELFNDASVNSTEVNATRAACLAITPADTHRSIGATLSGNVAAGAGKKLKLVVEYVFG